MFRYRQHYRQQRLSFREIWQRKPSFLCKGWKTIGKFSGNVAWIAIAIVSLTCNLKACRARWLFQSSQLESRRNSAISNTGKCLWRYQFRSDSLHISLLCCVWVSPGEDTRFPEKDPITTCQALFLPFVPDHPTNPSPQPPSLFFRFLILKRGMIMLWIVIGIKETISSSP